MDGGEHKATTSANNATGGRAARASRRWPRVLLRSTLALVLGLILLLALVVAMLQNSAIATRAANALASRFSPWPDAHIAVQRARLRGLGGVTLAGVRITRADGQVMVALDTMQLRIQPLALLWGRVSMPVLRVLGADVRMRQRADSSWDLLAPFMGGDTIRASRTQLRIGEAELLRSRLEAHWLAQSDSVLRVEDITVRLAGLALPEPMRFSLDTLSARIYPPLRPAQPAMLGARLRLSDGRLVVDGFSLRSDSSNVSAAGTLLVPGGRVDDIHDADFTLAASPLDFRDVGAFLPGFDVPGSLRLQARVRGTPSLLDIEVDGRSFDGATLHVAGTLTPRTQGDVRYQLQATLHDLDAALWSGSASGLGKVDATADVALAGQALDSVTGSLQLTLGGTRLGSGRLRSAQLAAQFTEGRAEVTAEAEATPWVHVALRGAARPFAPTPDYAFDIDACQLEPLGTDTTLQLHAGTVQLHLAGAGVARANARGSAQARFSAGIGAVMVRGGELTANWQDGQATAKLEASVAEGQVSGSAQVDWRHAETRISAARLSARGIALAGLVDSAAGTLDLEGTGDFVPGRNESLRANATATLHALAWAGNRLTDTASANITVRSGRLHAEAVAAGPAGRMLLRGNARPFANTPSWTLERLELHDVDLARADTAWPNSSINALLTLEGRGRSPRATSARGLLTFDSLRVGDQVIRDGRVELALGEGELRADLTMKALHGSIAANTRGTPFDSVPAFHVENARFRDLDLALLTRGSFKGALTGTMQANGTLPGGALPDVRGRLELASSPINGGRLRDGRATFALQASHASLDLELRTDSGVVAFNGQAQVTRDTTAASGVRVSDANVEGTARLPDLAALMGQDSNEAAVDAHFAMAGEGLDIETMQWTAHARATGRWGGAHVDTLLLRAGVHDARLQLDTFRLRSNVAHGDGSGMLALRGRSSIPPEQGMHIRIVVDSVAPFAAMLGRHPLALRTGVIDLRGTNDAGGTQLQATVNLAGLVSAWVMADSIALQTGATLDGSTLRQAAGQFTGIGLAQGSMYLTGMTAQGTYDGAALSIEGSVQRDEQHDLQVKATATPREHSVVFEQMQLALPGSRWTIAQAARIVWSPQIRIEGLTLTSGAEKITLNGRIDRAGTQDLQLQLDSVPVQGFAEFAGINGLSGTANGRLELTGPATHIALRGDITTHLNGVSGHIAVEPAGDDALSINVAMTDAAHRPLRINGQMPFAVSIAPGDSGFAGPTHGNVGFTVSADSFALGWLQPFVQPLRVDRLQGWLTADAHFTGTFDAPEASGTARFANLRVSVSSEGIDYRNVQAALALQGDRVQVSALRAEAEGTVTGEGQLFLESLSRPRFNVTLHFNRFRAVRNQWVRLGVSGDAHVTGDLAKPVVEGALTLVDTDVYADPAGQGSTARPIELTAADLAMLESYFGYKPSAAATMESDPLMPWSMNLKVTLGTNVWARRTARPEMRVQLGGSLEVRKAPQDSMQLFGSIEVLPQRSYFEEFGKHFSVSDGTITFNGSVWGWTANIKARYLVPSFKDPNASEVTITMDVTGPMDDLRLTLGSEPPLETADILSYLATGRPAESAASFGGGGARGGLLTEGATLALGTAANLLEHTAGETVGLDVVEIRQDGLRGATLIAGRYVSPRLYVGFQQPLTLRDNQDPANTTSRGTQVEIEYTAYRWLLLNLQSGQSTLSFFLRTKRAF